MSEATIEKAANEAQVVVLDLPALKDKAVIKSDQDHIRKGLVKLDAQIHDNAIQCYMHAEKHGDTSLMRRLFVDIVDAKSGYRRQGLIVHMRAFTPMELVGDTIKLTGTMPDGTRKPWLIEEANANGFTSMASARETTGRPIFRETLMSKVNAALKEWKNAQANTVIGPDGKPTAIDKTKPFYDGLHTDKLEAFFTDVEQGLVNLDNYRDSTKEVRDAQKALTKAQAEQAAIEQAAVA